MSEKKHSLDWDKCIFCQATSNENLQHPFAGKRPDSGDGYLTLSQNIQRFHELKCLPMSLNQVLLGESEHVAETLRQNNAQWHKNCSNRFNKLKLQRAEKRKNYDDEEATSSSSRSKFTRTSCGKATSMSQDRCFFCGETSGALHQASTFNMDQRVRKCALDLQDTVLLAKLSAGDLISQEAMYHSKCLISLYNKASRASSETDADTSDKWLQGIALAELIAYIEDSYAESKSVTVFKLADLAKLYHTRLEQLGAKPSGRIHSTDLKHRILANFPDMQVHKEGRDVLLAFNQDIGIALKTACKHDYDNEAIILKQAANIVRRDMFNTKTSFDGTFARNCQQDPVSQTLLTLVGMILGGPNIKSQSSNSVEAQSTLSISQMLQYNSTQCRRESTRGSYHASDREPPLPVYIGLLVHAETRKRGLVEKLQDLGLSISYDRVLSLSTNMGNEVCARYEAEKVVCPPKLRHQIFTTSAVDNIDHNPSSTTAQGSFHGTGISLFQHPDADNEGENRAPVDVPISNKKTLTPLPATYTNVPPVALPKKEPAVPQVQGQLKSSCQLIPGALDAEYRWLKHVQDEVVSESSNDMHTSWAAFHASHRPSDPESPLDISSLLPLFEEQAKSVVMIRHSMDVVKHAVDFLNPAQVPVVVCDQPLFAIAKQIQWHFPETHGEQHVVIMLGGLHIELAALKAIRSWLEDSGWTSAVVQSSLASAGTADSFLKASHISRTRHAHQVTASALYILMRRAYQQYLNTLDQGCDPVGFDEWRNQKEVSVPQFQYWSITMNFELTILIFVRSLRDGNFHLYKDALTKLVPWFFALDHPNYARWLPVHIRDMMLLESRHPSVEAEFGKGKFVIRKTHHSYSSIPIDQAHEQNNKCVKGDGGAVGLTENSAQLLRWMVSGPEMARALNEFESSQEFVKCKQTKGPDLRHHEQVKGVQTAFRKQAAALCETIEEMGNPFLETSEDLLVLDTRDIVDPQVADTVRHIERVGQERYEEFVEERLEKRTKPLSDPIKKNKYPLFSCPPARAVSKTNLHISSLKQNCSLFSQLYVSCQVRDGDLDEFFRHENQSIPPSLSQNGKLRHGTKSDLLNCLTELCPTSTDFPEVDALLLDGAAIINMLKPGASSTFQDYANQIFLPYLKQQLQSTNRVDIIWDEYMTDSLKATTRSQRGKGVRRRVKPETRLPGNWEAFLRNDDNKRELFTYLAEESVTVECGQQHLVISTKGRDVLSNDPRQNTSGISPCTRTADTRLLLHATDVAQQGLTKVTIRTVDTDVVVLSIAMYPETGLEEIWISFGTGKNFRMIAAHDISQALGPQKSKALLAFHALTGCDQTSSFAGKGKKTAWETWKICDEATPVFETLSHVPTEQTVQEAMPLIEKFVVLMYDRTSTYNSVNEVRKELFTRKGRAIDVIPPTSAALMQHVKRAAYQAGHCWGQTLVSSPVLPSPADWGWTCGSNQAWEPLWTLLPQASRC